jgi:hypothetical protein
MLRPKNTSRLIWDIWAALPPKCPKSTCLSLDARDITREMSRQGPWFATRKLRPREDSGYT